MAGEEEAKPLAEKIEAPNGLNIVGQDPNAGKKATVMALANRFEDSLSPPLKTAVVPPNLLGISPNRPVLDGSSLASPSSLAGMAPPLKTAVVPPDLLDIIPPNRPVLKEGSLAAPSSQVGSKMDRS
ncbi:MAG: hypothetical protein WCJ74_03020 [bacterium]